MLGRSPRLSSDLVVDSCLSQINGGCALAPCQSKEALSQGGSGQGGQLDHGRAGQGGVCRF